MDIKGNDIGNGIGNGIGHSVKLIGLMGNKRVGKDTFADYLVSKYGFVKLAFADPIKEVAKLLFNLDDNDLLNIDKEYILPEFNISLRQFYQIFGTELMRKDIFQYLPKFPKNIWINTVFNKIDKLQKEGYNKFVISDVRFNEEAVSIFEKGGILIKINKDLDSNNIDTHLSEVEINSISDDMIKYYIDNNDTRDIYYEKIDEIINSINSKSNSFFK